MVLPVEVEALIASLRRQIAALEAEVADLRRQLGQDSSTGSKPPSSDGLKKKPRVGGSLRGRSGKASGGQSGHQGGTLRQVADPDWVIEHTACACGHCGSPLDPKSSTGIEKQIIQALAHSRRLGSYATLQLPGWTFRFAPRGGHFAKRNGTFRGACRKLLES